MLLNQLQNYLTTVQYPGEKLSGLRILSFLDRVALPFHRETLEGHITASAFIVSFDHHKVALLHHAKLNKWLQPGGHCDGNPDTWAVAQKEAQEETGISHFISQNEIWDVDVHWIPDRKDVPGHWHYDIRYLLQTQEGEETLRGNEESHAVKWVLGEELPLFTQESSIHRMWQKLRVKNMSSNRA